MNKLKITGFLFAICILFQIQATGYAQSDTHRRYIVTDEADCNELTFDGYAYRGAMNRVRMAIQDWWGPDNTQDCTAEVIISADYTGDYIDLDASVFCPDIGYTEEEYNLSLNLRSSLSADNSGVKTMIFRSENPDLEHGFILNSKANSSERSWIWSVSNRRIYFENTNVLNTAGQAPGLLSFTTGLGFSFIDCDLYFTHQIQYLNDDLFEMKNCDLFKTDVNYILSNPVLHSELGYIREVDIQGNVFHNGVGMHVRHRQESQGIINGYKIVGNKFYGGANSVYFPRSSSMLNDKLIFQDNKFYVQSASADAILFMLPRNSASPMTFSFFNDGFDTGVNSIPDQCLLKIQEGETINSPGLNNYGYDTDNISINWIEETNSAVTYTIIDACGNVDFTDGIWIHDKDLPGPVRILSNVAGDPDVRRVFVTNNTIKSIVRQSLYIPPIYRGSGMDFNPDVSGVQESSGSYDVSWDFSTSLSAANGPFLLEVYRSNSRGDLLERIHSENLAYDTGIAHTLAVAESAGASQWISLTMSSYGHDVNENLTDNSLGTSEAIAIPLKIPANIPQSVCADGTPLSISIPPIPMNNGGTLYPISWTVERSYGGSSTNVTPAANTSPELVLDNPQPGDYHVTLTVGTPTDYTYVQDYIFTVNTMENCISHDQCIGSFSPETGNYILQAWVSEEHLAPVSTYSHTGVRIEFLASQEVVEQSGLFLPSGEIIDSWQRIEEEFTVPSGVDQIRIVLENISGDIVGYIDDIRIQPVNAVSKSYVYDPVLGKLKAEMDENNYATFYDYNREGKLIRIRKETERGVMTIQETNYNTSQLNQ